MLAVVAVVSLELWGCRPADCSAMAEQWDNYVSTPAVTACTTSSDCIAVGGQPAEDPCNGHSAIGGCGAAVNAKAYAGSFAARMEQSFPASCPDHRAYDCSPAYAECLGGRCVVRLAGCCGGCRPDAAPDLRVDVPFTPRDTSGEVASCEAGGSESDDGGAGGCASEAGAGR